MSDVGVLVYDLRDLMLVVATTVEEVLEELNRTYDLFMNADGDDVDDDTECLLLPLTMMNMSPNQTDEVAGFGRVAVHGTLSVGRERHSSCMRFTAI